MFSFKKFGQDLQERIALYACCFMSGVFAMLAVFVLAYPAYYPLTMLGQVGLMPAASWVAYYMTYKLYQKNSLLQYFAIGLGLVLVACFSCYAAFLISGLSSEQFVWAVVALVVTGMWFGYGAAICLLVKLFRKHR